MSHSSNKNCMGRAIAFGYATSCHLSVHSLELLCSGSDDDSCGDGTGTGAPGDGSHGGRRHTSGAGKFSEGVGVPVFVLSLFLRAVNLMIGV